MRDLLLVIFPAVALADVSLPQSDSASCRARLETAGKEFIRRARSSEWGRVDELNGSLRYFVCVGDPPETDCYMDAIIERDPHSPRKASAWRMSWQKRATIYEVEWTRSAAGQRASIGYECYEWPCSQWTRARAKVFVSVFRAALDACLEAGGS
jgi:hypothetical protein